MDKSVHLDYHIMISSPNQPHPQPTFPSSNHPITTITSHTTFAIPSFTTSRPSSPSPTIFSTSTSSSTSTTASLPPPHPPDHEILAGYACLLPGIRYTFNVCQVLNWYNFLASLGRSAMILAAQSDHAADSHPSTAHPSPHAPQLPWQIRSALIARHQEYRYVIIAVMQAQFPGVDILQVPYEDFRCPHLAEWDPLLGTLWLDRLMEPGERRREWLRQQRVREVDENGRAMLEGLGPAGPGKNRDWTGVYACVARRAVQRLQWRGEGVGWEVEFRSHQHMLDEMVIELGNELGYVIIRGAPKRALGRIKEMVNVVLEEDGFGTRCVETRARREDFREAARELAMSTDVVGSTVAPRPRWDLDPRVTAILTSDAEYTPLSSPYAEADADPLLGRRWIPRLTGAGTGERKGVSRRLAEWMRKVKRESTLPGCAKLRKRPGPPAGRSGRVPGSECVETDRGTEKCEKRGNREACTTRSKTPDVEEKEAEPVLGESRNRRAMLSRWWGWSRVGIVEGRPKEKEKEKEKMEKMEKQKQKENQKEKTPTKRGRSESEIREWIESMEEVQRKAGARSRGIRQVREGNGGKEQQVGKQMTRGQAGAAAKESEKERKQRHRMAYVMETEDEEGGDGDGKGGEWRVRSPVLS